ncbi:hypothetical protein P167DRAFT_550345 [Morchella conica CCBAS932]|uniref:Uncharacterized protein n=1 Tax=Morchella conica CCBAS932 TaxID=1392247 RepID=A0A3N4K829_9PEZI|nr:hypothetical protein P167DRAFT_550345 [Morchella conica CCBAS932]
MKYTDGYPMYTCATAIRASLRKVTFMWNNTMSNNTTESDTALMSESFIDRLASLKVTAISPTVAPRTTWGIELCRGFNASDISPLWGPLHPSNRTNSDAQNLTVLEADYLYLPAGQGNEGIIDSHSGTGA